VRNVAGAVGPRLMSSRPQVEVVFDLTRLPFELRVKVAIAAALQRSTSRARRLSRVCREFRQAIAPLQWSVSYPSFLPRGYSIISDERIV
jgi:hypothetical protein